MVKYIQKEIDTLKAIKDGMTANAAKWTGQPIDTTDIDTAITILETHADDLETAQIALGKLQQTIHQVVDDQALVSDQAINLARGIHANEEEKLLDYGIKLPKSAVPQPIPGQAIISSLVDDADGEGFVITIQPLANSSDFEIWRGISASPDVLVLAPENFTYLTASKKLTYTDDAVLKGKRYFYRVRGFNRTGKGEWSTVASRVQ